MRFYLLFAMYMYNIHIYTYICICMIQQYGAQNDTKNPTKGMLLPIT
jgi:hypothetical protein